MDILIPFVDSEDERWLEIFCKAKNLHPRTERAKEFLFLPFRRRYSSHGLFKYWWRALDKNYKSLGKVHLLLMQESQFPKFLNKNDSRIVVHYHRDFIPEQYRPCFNSSTIELCAIKKIGFNGNFIVANDDMYVNSPCDDSYFEKDGKPLTYLDVREPYGAGNTFRKTLKNGHALVQTHYNSIVPYYQWHHLFQVYNGEFCNDFLTKEWATISKCMGRWRSGKDINHMVLMMAQNFAGVSVHDVKFPHLGYYEMPQITDATLADADTRQVICFNDTDGKTIKATSNYLARKYPDKSSFEI